MREVRRIPNEPASPSVLVNHIAFSVPCVTATPTKLSPLASPTNAIMSQQTAWEKTKTYSKAGFDKGWQALDKLGAPVNRLSNRLGAEAFWPTTLDKESDKCARILRSFCKDGFYSKLDDAQADKAARAGEKLEGPKGKQRVLKKIPEKVIREAVGLCIFTTMRTGLWVSGSGGSGVLVAKNKETGEWSPPSGILMHTYGLGFLVGVDIYDCIIVINTYKALAGFTKLRCTLGAEVSAVAGPVGIGGVLDSELHKRQAPVWTYLKSRGFYAGVQIDGTIVIERTDENEVFYGEKIAVADILAGKARHPPTHDIHMLMETLKAAQGDSDVDESALPEDGMAPSDMEIEAEGHIPSIPDPEDPDPYGVKALEKEGLEIREAGTGERPSMEVFEFKPVTSSPVYAHFRNSLDSPLTLRTNRASTMSISSIDRGTQTEDDDGTKPSSLRAGRGSSTTKTTEHVNDSDEQDDTSKPVSETETSEVLVGEAKPMVAKATVVTIPRRPPPALPPRNPQRVTSPTDAEDDGFDKAALSPTKPKNDGFDDVSLNESQASNYDHSEGFANNVDDDAKDVWKENGVKKPNEGTGDEFHSIPSSPVEDRKEDFS